MRLLSWKNPRHRVELRIRGWLAGVTLKLADGLTTWTYFQGLYYGVGPCKLKQGPYGKAVWELHQDLVKGYEKETP